MAVRNLKNIQPHIWIPPAYSANFKITVTRTDGTVDDITDSLLSWKIQDGVTESIGAFEFSIPNPNDYYTSLWQDLAIFKFYADYTGSTPTTLRFRGRIERPSNQNNNLKCTGRSEALFLVEANVSKIYNGVDTAVILLDLINTYGQSRYDVSLIPATSGTTLTVNWIDRPFLDCFIDLCNAAGYDGYIDCNLFVRYFATGTVNNDTDIIVHDQNLIEVGDFTPDKTRVKNKIRVYGATVDGVQVIYTANDSASQTSNGIRVKNINDDSITSQDQAKELGDFELVQNKNPPVIGDVKSVMLATIQPGENIRISDPMEGLNPTYYNANHYVTEFDDSGFFTTITINKEARTIAHIFKQNIETQSKSQQTSSNIENLDFSAIELFNSDSGTHSGTVIQDGVLKLSGVAPGTWTSPVINTADQLYLNQIRVVLSGDNIPGVTLQMSANGGLNYEAISIKTLTTISSSLGSNIILRITLGENSSQVDSFSIQYSTRAS